MAKQYFQLDGLDCANCAAKIEERIAELPQVELAHLQFVEKKLTIQAASAFSAADIQAVCDAVEGGIRVSPLEKGSSSSPKASESSHEHRHEEASVHKGIFSLAVVLFAAGAILHWTLPGMPVWIFAVLMGASSLLAAWPVLLDAAAELKGRQMGEHLLLVIALIAAFAIGEYLEGALVALLFTVGEWLESYAVGRSRKAIEELAKIRPDKAWRLMEDGSSVPIAAEEVAIGDRLLIPAHERIPVDGVVEEGVSEVDTAALTGESQPTYAGPGTPLLSGFINGNGSLVMCATHPAEESAAARILEMVSDSAARKGQSEKFITRFARIYTPLVTLAAVLIAILPPLFGGVWTDWIHRALVFLVASCPCALVISVPLGFYAGIGAASRRGILIKGGRYVEALAKVRAAAFDKTGTLTTGELVLARIERPGTLSENEALCLAASLEQHSAHPAAKALVQAAKAASLSLMPMADVEELPALGLRVQADGHRILCGNARLLAQESIPIETLPAAPVYLALDGRVEAAFFMKAELQPEAPRAIQRLKDCGVSRVVMLTGDHPAEAARIAKQVGLSDYHAELLPENKRDFVRRLQQETGPTLFVGDGINDAPVLAQADVGIAMGLGSAAAIESADAVLMAGSLDQLPEAIRLSRRVMQVVRTNIVFALSVKAAVLILAICGWAPMWAAVFADVGVSLISVLNSARLLLNRPDTKYPRV